MLNRNRQKSQTDRSAGFEATLPAVLQGNRESRQRAGSSQALDRTTGVFPQTSCHLLGALDSGLQRTRDGSQATETDTVITNFTVSCFRAPCPLPKRGTLRTGTESLTCRSPSAATSRPALGPWAPLRGLLPHISHFSSPDNTPSGSSAYSPDTNRGSHYLPHSVDSGVRRTRLQVPFGHHDQSRDPRTGDSPQRSLRLLS